jgi:hypothetical protein
LYTFELIGTTELLTEKMDEGVSDFLANNFGLELATLRSQLRADVGHARGESSVDRQCLAIDV